MCSCDDAETPNFVSQEWRKTRKPHQCTECRRTLPAGSQMEYTAGHWTGGIGFDHFYTCARCSDWRLAFTRIECRPPFGELLETIDECLRGESELIAMWRKEVRFERLKRKAA